MKIVLDSANVEKIKAGLEIYQVLGVTTNPTILTKEKRDFFPLITEIREAIGDKDFHIQVTGSSCEEMVREAGAITACVGKETFIKVPTNEEGLKTIKILKEKGYKVTATAIYQVSQAVMAGIAGADYVAPYYNRMCNEGIAAADSIRQMASLFKEHNLGTKIIVASLKNADQVLQSFAGGAYAVTTTPELYREMVESALITETVGRFKEDWEALYGNKRIYEL